MLDKSIQYYDVLMKRKIGAVIPNPSLPPGFRFNFFKLGDEKSWAEIETSVGEFEGENTALKYFQDIYLPHLDELGRRCIFVEDVKGAKDVYLHTQTWSYKAINIYKKAGFNLTKVGQTEEKVFYEKAIDRR